MTLPLPGGRLVLPGNRFDLAPQRIAEPPQVSVVIPWYGDAPAAHDDLRLVLAALAEASYPASRLEVIVVDDGSPRPPEVGPGIVLLRQEHDGFGAAAARNLGAEAAGGSVLCFLDADTVPAADYVEVASRLPAVVPDALVVGRRSHVDLDGWGPAELASWFAGGRAPKRLGDPAWLADGYAGSRDLLDADDRSFRYVISAVLTMDRAFFRELGGFDATMRAYGGEDWELAYRAWNSGAVLVHEPAALAWHNGPDWAARGGSSQAKNAETLMLAGKIREPHTRGRGVLGPAADVVVLLSDTAPAAGEAAVYLCVDAILATADAAVWLDARYAECFAADPRVRTGPVAQEARRHARFEVRVFAPCLLDLQALLARLGDAGRLTVSDSEGLLVTVARSRALARARRWSQDCPGRDLVEELFTAVDASAPECDVVRLPVQPDLAATLAARGE